MILNPAGDLEFQTCPDFKGIKTPAVGVADLYSTFQTCPDFKGIKTSSSSVITALLFQTCPDFKGIKTQHGLPCPLARFVPNLP